MYAPLSQEAALLGVNVQFVPEELAVVNNRATLPYVAFAHEQFDLT
jgi:hypothetical protein